MYCFKFPHPPSFDLVQGIYLSCLVYLKKQFTCPCSVDEPTQQLILVLAALLENLKNVYVSIKIGQVRVSVPIKRLDYTKVVR